MTNNLSAKYNPSDVEDKWYKYWMDHKFFASHPDEREPYTIVMPPPNVTGILHMGHMMNNTLQDVLVRRARMVGKNACWVPGTDHASIATEAKVVNRLASQGIKKSDLSREEFLEHVWDWTHEHGGIIMEQLKKIGASCDWDRIAFTMDETRSRSVIKVFVDLFNKGLIYRGIRMVNWDPKALTALSDEEVIHKEEDSKLYYLRYRVEGDASRYIVVATTRPETIFGDTAVCVHPEDPRYTWLEGKRVIVPGVGRAVPIIMDEYVDREFGTGCLKVTPSHDINDYRLGEKYHLPAIDIFNPNGTLNEHGGKYQGMDRFDVRREIILELDSLDLLEKVEDYHNSVGYSERTDVPIEPKLSMQWFLRMEDLSKPALRAVMEDEVKLVPPKFKGMYAHWMENIKDWCISRQLWWGHRIPAYYLPDGSYIVAESMDKAVEMARKQLGDDSLTAEDLSQESDCLDTWFSSWLWPMSVWGDVFDKDNEDLKYYYPTSDLVSAPDIIFFWVARMIIAGYEYMDEKPFEHVYLTGIVRDKLGRKMSKQLGNSPDPLLLIEKYGADGVRMGLMTAASAGNDILFDESLCEQGRNFNNKIWNSFRLIKGWEVDSERVSDEGSQVAQRWFKSLLAKSMEELDDLFSKYRISEAMMLIYKLIRDDFSGTYLELIKPPYGEPIDASTLTATLDFFDILLSLLHPFMPFITEELWQHLADRTEGETIMLRQLPKEREYDSELLRSMEVAKELVTAIRSVRAAKNIPAKAPLTLYTGEGAQDPAIEAVVRKLSFVTEIREQSAEGASVVNFLVGKRTFGIPIEGFVDTQEEVAKLEDQRRYYENFLKGVRAKLGNENFVNRAPESVVALERKKESDALEKLEVIRRSLESLSN